MSVIFDSFVCEVASYICGDLMFLCVSGDSFIDEGDDPSWMGDGVVVIGGLLDGFATVVEVVLWHFFLIIPIILFMLEMILVSVKMMMSLLLVMMWS